jgi:hypothetical protein
MYFSSSSLVFVNVDDRQITAMICDTTRMMILDATLSGAAKLGAYCAVCLASGAGM